MKEGIDLERYPKNEGALQQEGRMAWLCSYTPVEIIAACGLQPYRFNGQEGTSYHADSFLHSSLCFYVRCSLERFLKDSEKDLQGVVLVNSCIAMYHLYHALKNYSSLPFVYLLDLPRDDTSLSRKYLAQNLQKLHIDLNNYFGKNSTEAQVWEQIHLYRENRSKLLQLYEDREGILDLDGSYILRLVHDFSVLSPAAFREKFDLHNGKFPEKKVPLKGPRIFLTGSTIPGGVAELVHELGGVIVLDDLCTGKRLLQTDTEPGQGEDPYSCLARTYLGKESCPRMRWNEKKLTGLKKMLHRYDIEGVIFYYLKFCDPWYYFGLLLKETIKDIPVLILEGDYSGVECGQMQTRISAFLEMIS